MARVKICGLTRPCDIEAVNAQRPDYIGFVFAESRRKLLPEQAVGLRKLLSPDIIPVGVFVDEPIENILSLVRGGVVDMIQLHGSEDEEYIHKLKLMTDKSVIKAVAIEKEGDAQKWEQSSADYLLLDHRSGGTGKSFDWGLVGNLGKEFFLAGGLSPENVAGAIEKTMPFAVDVSSGVEAGGVKDLDKIRDFVRMARGMHS
ncbi:MAG: phosphoribosylanthranilate isomerase [Oscillospiraceae bacterium]|nr:phosphoribosylanthranilate isomerase [Oscillospiraceae bacterium]